MVGVMVFSTFAAVAVMVGASVARDPHAVRRKKKEMEIVLFI